MKSVQICYSYFMQGHVIVKVMSTPIN